MVYHENAENETPVRIEASVSIASIRALAIAACHPLHIESVYRPQKWRQPPTMARGKQAKSGNGATVGFEETLWHAADKLRGSMDAAEYKHVVLGPIFLKYVSDA